MRLTRLVSLLSVVGLLLGMMVASVGASSHREAPLISTDAQADNTDLWAFVDPNAPGMLNIIAAYYPFEQPAGFPNGYTFGDDVLYTIRVDNNGDGIADKSYGFQFTTGIRFQGTFYSNVTLADGLDDVQITSPDDPELNIVQTYNVAVADNSSLPIAAADSPKTVLSGIYTSPNNIGPNSTPDFQSTMAQAVTDLPGGGKVWAGQSDDPFFADLGALWDLGQLRTLTGDNGGQGIDTLADFNVQVIALQVPFEAVTANHMAPTDPTDPNAAVGIWAANFRRSTTTLRNTILNRHVNDAKNYEGNQPTHKGAWVQVSRLGMPLTNEVIIPLAEKDRWNRTDPRADAYFNDYFTNSHLAVLLNALFQTPGATTGRADLLAIFQTGIPGLTQVGNDPAYADELRINLAVASGFPNGRNLTDDIVDVELSVVGLSDGTFAGLKTSGISDGVDANDVPFMDAFPYVGVPHDGYHFNPDGGDD
jgi:hypothetical protein